MKTKQMKIEKIIAIELDEKAEFSRLKFAFKEAPEVLKECLQDVTEEFVYGTFEKAAELLMSKSIEWAEFQKKSPAPEYLSYKLCDMLHPEIVKVLKEIIIIKDRAERAKKMGYDVSDLQPYFRKHSG